MYGVLAPTTIAYGSTYYYFPELRSSQKELFKAFQRTMRVGVAGMKMTYVYKFDDLTLEEKHEKAALILRQAFIRNAGLYIKFGQLIASLDVIVPQEYRKHFEQLCHDCPESDFEAVRENIESQYGGKKIEDVFSKFDKKPIKSASIGQVHHAVLKETGQEVAVKVMHNWLQQHSPGDLKLVEIFIEVGEKIFPEFKFKWFGEECRYNLTKELDFKREVQNGEKCREMLKKHQNIRVPRNFLNLCTEKVIVMEWISGIPIMDIQQLKQSQYNLPQISKIISQAFCQMIFQDGIVHADPHQGNFLIRRKDGAKHDKETEVVLLDHGLYLSVSDETRMYYSRLWKAIITQDEPEMQKQAINLGAGKFFKLFVSMVTSRNFDDIVDNSEDMKNRLRSPDDIEHRKKLANFGAQYHKEIITLLHEMNRDLLLLFKINDFLRTIDNKLGAPINTFQITLDYCYKNEEQYNKMNHIKRNILQKIQDKFYRMVYETRLNIAKILIQLKIMNPI